MQLPRLLSHAQVDVAPAPALAVLVVLELAHRVVVDGARLLAGRLLPDGRLFGEPMDPVVERHAPVRLEPAGGVAVALGDGGGARTMDMLAALDLEAEHRGLHRHAPLAAEAEGPVAIARLGHDLVDHVRGDARVPDRLIRIGGRVRDPEVGCPARGGHVLKSSLVRDLEAARGGRRSGERRGGERRSGPRRGREGRRGRRAGGGKREEGEDREPGHGGHVSSRPRTPPWARRAFGICPPSRCSARRRADEANDAAPSRAPLKAGSYE